MLNLAIFVLIALVVSALWLVLRPPAQGVAEGDASGAAPPAEGDNPAGSPQGPDPRASAPPQPDEPSPNH